MQCWSMNPHIPWGEAVFGGFFRVLRGRPEVAEHRFLRRGPGRQSAAGGGFNDHLGYTDTVNTLDDADVYALDAGGRRLSLRRTRAQSSTKHMRRSVCAAKDGSFVGKPAHGALVGARAGDGRGEGPGARAAPCRDRSTVPAAAVLGHGLRAQISRPGARSSAGCRFRNRTCVYADADGHIFYLAGGRIPARTSGDYAFWSGIVPGDTLGDAVDEDTADDGAAAGRRSAGGLAAERERSAVVGDGARAIHAGRVSRLDVAAQSVVSRAALDRR